MLKIITIYIILVLLPKIIGIGPIKTIPPDSTLPEPEIKEATIVINMPIKISAMPIKNNCSCIKASSET